MVIFGAGASYDSVPHAPPLRHPMQLRMPGQPQVNEEYRPPLAKDLFQPRAKFDLQLQRFPRCRHLIPRIRNAPLTNRTIEAVLEEIQSERSTNPDREPQLAAIRFYLQSMLFELENDWAPQHNGHTNYAALMERIDHFRRSEPVLLVTFNYDRLLEGALDWGFADPNAYIAHERYKVIKLHGSVNWGRELATSVGSLHPSDWYSRATAIINKAAELEVTDRFHVMTGELNWLKGAEENGVTLFPAIAIPVEAKTHFACPQAHLDELKRLLPEVTKILIIGWAGADQHFVRQLVEWHVPDTEIMIVNGKGGGAATAQRLVGLRFKPHLPDVAFTDFFQSSLPDEFLRP